MVLEICGDRRIENPTDEEVRWAVLELDTGNDDAFLILSGGEMSYVQCAGDRNVGFDLEYQEGGIDPLEFRFHAMTDRVGTTGTTWLGLTVSCAQCHTHKYDPISHTEYFGMMAYLNNADEPEIPVWTEALREAHSEAEAKAAAMESTLAASWPVLNMSST